MQGNVYATKVNIYIATISKGWNNCWLIKLNIYTHLDIFHSHCVCLQNQQRQNLAESLYVNIIRRINPETHIFAGKYHIFFKVWRRIKCNYYFLPSIHMRRAIEKWNEKKKQNTLKYLKAILMWIRRISSDSSKHWLAPVVHVHRTTPHYRNLHGVSGLVQTNINVDLPKNEKLKIGYVLLCVGVNPPYLSKPSIYKTTKTC